MEISIGHNQEINQAFSMVLHSNIRAQNSYPRTFDYLSTGQISDEVQKTYNKYIQRFLENFAQKYSRTKNTEDVFKRRVLVASDPLITSLRRLPSKYSTLFSTLVYDLLTSLSSIVESTNEIQCRCTSDESTSDNSPNNSTE